MCLKCEASPQPSRLAWRINARHVPHDCHSPPWRKAARRLARCAAAPRRARPASQLHVQGGTALEQPATTPGTPGARGGSLGLMQRRTVLWRAVMARASRWGSCACARVCWGNAGSERSAGGGAAPRWGDGLNVGGGAQHVADMICMIFLRAP